MPTAHADSPRVPVFRIPALPLLAEICRLLSEGGPVETEAQASPSSAPIPRKPLTERQAALLVGVYPETLRRWKREHPGLAECLAVARAAFRPSAAASHPVAPATAAPAPRPPGRPSRYSPALVAKICKHVRLEGLTDSAAGLREGIPANTIGYWKRTRPEFIVALSQAAADCAQAHPPAAPAPLPPGPHPWRYHAMALASAFPSEYGRRRPAGAPLSATDTVLPPPNQVVAPQMFANQFHISENSPASAASARASSTDPVRPSETPTCSVVVAPQMVANPFHVSENPGSSKSALISPTAALRLAVLLLHLAVAAFMPAASAADSIPAAAASASAPAPKITTNGRDEIVLSVANPSASPREFRLPAGAVYATPSGQRVVTLNETPLAIPAGATVDAVIPAAALSASNILQPGQPAALTADTAPALAPLFAYLAGRQDVPRATSQCAALALLEDIGFDQWQQFRGAKTAGATPSAPAAAAPLLESIDALGILRQIAPAKDLRLARDPVLKLQALHHPATRAKAAQIYGLAIPGDAPPGQTPPDLGQLLHTKPGDNCPICRMRAQMQAPPSQL